MMSNPEQILSEIETWAINEEKVSSVALVGSYATGKQTDASDIDLVVVSKSKEDLLRDRNWTNLFGKIEKEEIEDWGELSSIRICYSDCVEVEFGIVSAEWIKVPSDEGTSRVVNDGMKILYDPEGDLEKLKCHCNKKIQNKAGIGISTSSAVRNPIL